MNTDFTKIEVLQMLEEHIAMEKKKLGDQESAAGSSYGGNLERDLSSYEVVANGEQVKYPVCEPERLHHYLVDHDLKSKDRKPAGNAVPRNPSSYRV